MKIISLSTLSVSVLLLALASGCGGPRGVRITEGNQPVGAAPSGSAFKSNPATLVHVDKFERLATLRNAHGFAAGTFLETSDDQGNKTATLKTRANRISGLRTADIVEGDPQINNTALPVSAAESARLKKIYRDSTEE